MPGPLAGKTIVVTGSTRGIGKVIAKYLAKEGAEIVVTGRSEDKGTDNLPGTIRDTIQSASADTPRWTRKRSSMGAASRAGF